MTAVVLLNQLADFIENAVMDMQLLVPPKKDGKNSKPQRKPPGVYKMRLPERDVADAHAKRIPYIVLQVLHGEDTHEQSEDSTCLIRIIATTYSEDGGAGANDVLNVITRIRIALLEAGVIGEQFHLRKPLEWIVYPDDVGNYFFAELMSTWEMPPVHRQVNPKIWG